MSTTETVDSSNLGGETTRLTPPGALFSMVGATEGTTQWRAETLQMVNWGGFAGATGIAFHPGATLMTGASGTGKSTILDAYTALMMSSAVPFNGASNDGSGRVRGSEQRSLISYLRGQTDTTTDEDGKQTAKVLRGRTTATWGGVAMTFVSDVGKRFTAARLYYVPVGARTDGEVLQRMLTVDGMLDLAGFEQYAAGGFPRGGLRTQTPVGGAEITSHDTYTAFANRLFHRLGIGANGDGDKALLLLSRVQAGHQIRTVDALYKEMVLERPVTFEKADQALEHFDLLADTYVRMREEYEREQILAPIVDAHEQLVAARDTIEQIDTFGLQVPDGRSPLGLWSFAREADLVEGAITANRARRPGLQQDLTAAGNVYKAAEQTYREAQEQYRLAGGGTLEQLGTRIETAAQQATNAEIAAAELAAKTAIVLDGRDLRDREVFSGLLQEAARFQERLDDVRAELTRQQNELATPLATAYGTRKDLQDELRSLEGRDSRIPRALVELRNLACEATGLNATDLPFIAELIDVRPDEERWRLAIETALAAPARLMLVPRDMFMSFSIAIDPLQWRGQLRFIAADLHLPQRPPVSGDTTAGKLVFKDTSFTGWLMNYLADP